MLRCGAVLEPAPSLNACLLTVGGKFRELDSMLLIAGVLWMMLWKKTGSARIRRGFVPQAAQ
jgi:hypothetical protein